jgi:hypothetical protein
MSAFTVGSDHIDLMVTVAMRIPGFTEQYVNIPETADRLGQMLTNENYKSVNYRYDEQEEVPEYHWTPVAELQRESLGQMLLLQILKAAHCYDYQSCEHAGWKDSHAFWVSQAIQMWTEARLIEMGVAKVRDPWDSKRPPAFFYPDYIAWEWDRVKGFDFDAMDAAQKRGRTT